jgi:phosphoglycolate phosphatase-like HAD superfamily hydrolase
MGLWYRIEPENKGKTFETCDLIEEFLDIWLQTRKAEDIDASELAGVIDVLYDFQPVPGHWVLIEVRPKELARYISTYVNAKGQRKKMMEDKDVRLSKAYVKLLKKKYEPTPIMIAGISDEVTGEDGIVLIDGRHRIHAAVAAKIPTILAYINKSGLDKMDKATLLPA